jgi:hypothetical protein
VARRERRHRNDARDGRVSARVRPSHPAPTGGRSHALKDAGGAGRQRAVFKSAVFKSTVPESTAHRQRSCHPPSVTGRAARSRVIGNAITEHRLRGRSNSGAAAQRMVLLGRLGDRGGSRRNRLGGDDARSNRRRRRIGRSRCESGLGHGRDRRCRWRGGDRRSGSGTGPNRGVGERCHRRIGRRRRGSNRRWVGHGHRRRLGDGQLRRRRLDDDHRRHERCGRGNARGQERQRVEISLRIRGGPHAEMDVRLRHLGVAARADRSDAVALRDRCAARDRDRAEVGQRHGVPVSGRDRHALPRRRNGARERDRSGRWRRHRRAGITADVEPTVLSRGIRMRRIEEEGLQDGAGGGPRPGLACGREQERDDYRREELTTHRDRLSNRDSQTVASTTCLRHLLLSEE